MNILQCPYDRDTTNCAHSQDAGVQCQRERRILSSEKGLIVIILFVYTELCEDGDLRLAFITQGHVEVCYEETWGSICDTDFDNRDASVICRQLGFSIRGKALG